MGQYPILAETSSIRPIPYSYLGRNIAACDFDQFPLVLVIIAAVSLCIIQSRADNTMLAVRVTLGRGAPVEMAPNALDKLQFFGLKPSWLSW